MVTDNRVIVNQMFSILRWNLQLISEPGPDSVLHLCRLYPALESPLSPKEEYDPRLICDYGPVQAVPPVIMTQWFDHIEVRVLEGSKFFSNLLGVRGALGFVRKKLST